ncbi:MAG: ADP-forming succinate--CoA ligase subunit beta [Chloroflexi bacterium]|nr:ADP-forming succinate--CoA ligase subunit beta [Chloroflexota bacterium]
MNLHEYQGKEILRSYQIPVPRGEVATTPGEARAIAERYGATVVVKAQVLTGGRGKAGGVKLARTPAEAEAAAERILGMDIKGHLVRKVLVTEAAEITQELYLGAVIDRAGRAVTMMTSPAGGIDIEEVAAKTPERIYRVAVNPFLGLLDYQTRELGFELGLDGRQVREFTRIAQGLYRAFAESDASLVEINPLAIGRDGGLVALDAKVVLDDNGLFRHVQLDARRDLEAENPAERQARELGLSYVKLDGTIGCLVNGAGLAMATMDVVKLSGGEPANFLDIGGGARADRVAAALRIILADQNVRAVLVNIFGGITRCDEVARGIVTALQEMPTGVPFVVRLVGVNEAEGREILSQANLITATTMREAAEKVVDAARRQATLAGARRGAA